MKISVLRQVLEVSQSQAMECFVSQETCLGTGDVCSNNVQ